MISIKYVKTSNTFIIHIALEWKFNDECIAITKTIGGVIQWVKWYRNLENIERERERERGLLRKRRGSQLREEANKKKRVRWWMWPNYTM